MDTAAFLDELVKLGAATERHADAVKQKLDAAKRELLTNQLARYGAVGAVAGPAITTIGNVVAGRPIFGGGTALQQIRNVAGDAVKGGLAGGAIPVVRALADQYAEKNKPLPLPSAVGPAGVEQ
jgi:hypothetical protein